MTIVMLKADFYQLSLIIQEIIEVSSFFFGGAADLALALAGMETG